jgi:hypothetical protein
MLLSYNQIENICEDIRDNLISHSTSFTNEDFKLFEFLITNSCYHPIICPIVRILETLELTDTTHITFINHVIPYLLHSSDAYVRYAALDLITSRSGEHYNQLLFAAKIALEHESVEYIKDYLDSLNEDN